MKTQNKNLIINILMEVHMFRNIFKSTLLLAVLVVLITGNMQAQVANANVGATATVMTALTITKNTDVAFGNLGATTPGAVYLNPTSSGTNAYVGTTAALGTVTIAGANTQSIRLGWPASISLTSGGNSMTYTLEVNGSNTGSKAASSLSLTGGYVSVTTSAAGAYNLWVGGSLGTLSGQATGTYTGTANFTVEYN
jgi:hypothetical protein